MGAGNDFPTDIMTKLGNVYNLPIQKKRQTKSLKKSSTFEMLRLAKHRDVIDTTF